MNFQYISDNKGHTTAVQLQIPIEQWEAMKRKYKELEGVVNDDDFEVEDWQMELVRKEAELVASGTASLSSWNEVKAKLKFKS